MRVVRTLNGLMEPYSRRRIPPVCGFLIYSLNSILSNCKKDAGHDPRAGCRRLYHEEQFEIIRGICAEFTHNLQKVGSHSKQRK